MWQHLDGTLVGRGTSAVGEEAIETFASGFIYELGCLQGHQS